MIVKKSYYLADGWYRAKVKSVEDVEGKFGPAIKITLTVQTSPTTEKLVWLNTKFTEYNLTGKFLKALGYTLTEQEINTQDIVGKELMVEIRNVEQDGITKNKVIDFSVYTEEAQRNNSSQIVKGVFRNARNTG